MKRTLSILLTALMLLSALLPCFPVFAQEPDSTTGTAIADPKPETRGFRYSSTTKSIV